MNKLIQNSVFAMVVGVIVGCDGGAPSSGTAGTAKEADTAKATAQMDKGAAESVVSAAKEQVSSVVESAEVKAQSLIDQAMQYINEGKFDSADGLIAQLKDMKSSLPESIQTQIDNLIDLFTAKQSTESVVGSAEKMKDMLPGQGK